MKCRTLFISDIKIEYTVSKKSRRGIKILESISKEIPRGIITNGIIMEKDKVLEIFKEIKKQCHKAPKSINVLLDSNAIFYKEFILPEKIKDKNLDEFVNLEFKNIQEPQKEYLHSYIFHQREAKPCIRVCSIEKEIIQSYLDIFKNAGIQAKSFEMSNSVILNYFKVYKLSPFFNYCFVYLNRDVLNILLFENGANIFVSRTRIIEDSGTDEFTEKVLGLIDRAIKSNFSLNRIKSYKYITMGLDEGFVLPQVNFDNVPQERIEDEESLVCNFSYVLFNLFSNNSLRLDFLNKNKLLKKKEKSKTKGLNIFLIFLVLSLGLLGYFANSFAQDSKEELGEIQNSLKMLQENETVLLSDGLENSSEVLKEALTNFETIRNVFDTNVSNLGKKQLNAILTSMSETTVLTGFYYNAETNILTIEFNSPNINAGYIISQRIRNKNVFSEISYSLKQITVENTYNYSIDCKVSESKVIVFEDSTTSDEVKEEVLSYEID